MYQNYPHNPMGLKLSELLLPISSPPIDIHPIDPSHFKQSTNAVMESFQIPWYMFKVDTNFCDVKPT